MIKFRVIYKNLEGKFVSIKLVQKNYKLLLWSSVLQKHYKNVHRLVHGHMVLSLDKSHPVMCISSDKFMMHVIIVSSHRQLIAHLKHISIITYLAANRKERRKLDKIKKRKMRKCTICYFYKFYFRCISENIKLNIFHDFSRY